MRSQGFLSILALFFFLVAALTSFLISQGIEAAGETDSMLLRLSGALRVFIIDALWMGLHAHLSEGKESLVLTDARTLLKLEPDSPRIRYFLHWHLTFNMAYKAVTEAERIEWYREGLEIMDEGLTRNPDSSVLNRGMGMTCFLRSGRDEAFQVLCLERYGSYPMQLAPVYFEKAYTVLNDPDTWLFYFTSLLNAAHFEMESEAYGSASRLWQKVLDHLAPWIEMMENESDRKEVKGYYHDLYTYCSLMEGMGTQGGIRTEEMEKIEALRQSIKKNRYCDIWNDTVSE